MQLTRGTISKSQFTKKVLENDLSKKKTVKYGISIYSMLKGKRWDKPQTNLFT